MMLYAVILLPNGEYRVEAMDSANYLLAMRGQHGTVYLAGTDPGAAVAIAENLNKREPNDAHPHRHNS